MLENRRRFLRQAAAGACARHAALVLAAGSEAESLETGYPGAIAVWGRQGLVW